MEEAIQHVLKIFYGLKEQEDVRNLKVLHWSPENGIISVRWQQGDKTITVKSLVDETSGSRIINQLS
jgi:hypothetical protein